VSRLHIATRGLCSWRERLADPGRQWKRTYSAFETAVSWELASRREPGFPEPIAALFRSSDFGNPRLIFAVAEHKVDLPGGKAASQSDVWAVVNTTAGMVSLTVEAKAREAFGDDTLEGWLLAGSSQRSSDNRAARFEYIRAHLPAAESFHNVRYQLLHRCAAAVIEAKRLGFRHAAFVVQAFDTPDESFEEYAIFCRALGLPAARGTIATSVADGISLGVGWADCPLATDKEVADAA
jgi:hypothetical protein